MPSQEGSVDAHLHNAARTLAQILNARDPRLTYVVEVLPKEES